MRGKEPLAQLVEQQPFKLWVAGSIPARLTTSLSVCPHRLAWSGHRIFIPVTGVRIPLGTPVFAKVLAGTANRLIESKLSYEKRFQKIYSRHNLNTSWPCDIFPRHSNQICFKGTFCPYFN